MGKVTSACNPCAVRKIKCNGAKPCPACIKSGFDCTYSVHSKRGPKGPRPATRARIDKTSQQASPPNPALSLMRTTSDTSPALFYTSPGAASISPDPSLDQLSASRPSFGSDRSLSFTTPKSASVGLPPILLGDSDVTVEEVAAYFNVYQNYLYPVWPVVDHAGLLRKLRFEARDAETCTLAFALCSAVTARLRIDGPKDAPNTAPDLTTSTRFAELAESHRAMYNYRAQASAASILIPFFLHVHYDCQCRVFMDSLLLREAISVAQLMNLDKTPGSTDGISPQDLFLRRKIFWLLFISEKGCAMMRDFPTSLQPSIPLPDPKDEANPHLITAFVSLVRLFAAVYDVFGGGAGIMKQDSAASSQQYTPAFFAKLQEQLGQRPEVGPQTHEVQRADIFLTQQWLQVLVWRFSVSHVNLSGTSQEETLSFTFPAKVAKRTLDTLRLLSFESIVAHGRGMEQKVFEIAVTLLDVINVIPSESLHDSASSQCGANSPAMSGLPAPGVAVAMGTDSPRSTHSLSQPGSDEPLALLRRLSSILSIIGGRHSPYIGLLQKKISESQAPFTPGVLEMAAPSPGASSSVPMDDKASLRDRWENTRLGINTLRKQPSHAPQQENKEAGTTGWYAGARNDRSTHLSPPLPAANAPQHYFPGQLQNGGNGHWPINTEILGTMSEVGYLDGWRGVSQTHGQGHSASIDGRTRDLP